MSEGHKGTLRELQDSPFELLRELERRSRLSLSGAAILDSDAD